MKKQDFYNSITDSIIEALESGVMPWNCPWDNNSGLNGLPFNYKTKAAYNGMNIILLWMSAVTNDFKSSGWLTYKQSNELGGQVKKGEKGTPIIFYKKHQIEEDGQVKQIPIMRVFTVFNLSQIDGISCEEKIEEFDNELVIEPNEEIETVISNTGAVIHYVGHDAFYRPSTDEIYLPERNLFHNEDDLYTTIFYELIHWTSSKERLDRRAEFDNHKQSYAFEELVAEIGSAFCDAEFNVKGQLIGHASYIDSWLKCLRSDKKFIFKAAAKASKAHQYIFDLSLSKHNTNAA